MAPKRKATQIVDRFEDETVKDSTSKALEPILRFPPSLTQGGKLSNFFIPLKSQESRFILGPIFFPHAPEELPTYYPVSHDEPLLLSLPGLHRTGWETRGTIRSWPTVIPEWVQWVNRMSPFLRTEWENMHISELIDLSTRPISFNPELTASIACFWSISCNAFVFNIGMMSPSIYDVVLLTGLSSVGLEVNALLEPQPYPPPLFDNIPGSYSGLIHAYRWEPASGAPSMHEKIAFYLY
jgi:hypothetical protein